jgi:cytochrome P450
MGDEAFMADTMLTTDPPDHTRLRRVVNRAFTPRSIALLEDRVRVVARRLLEPMAGGQPIELVAEVAGPLPTIVIAELLGVPAEDAEQFRRWSEVVTGTATGLDIDAASMHRHSAELRAYLLDQIALRQHEPTDDLIGRMVEANQDGSMSDVEVAAACVLLLLAGNETTMRLITNMALALGRFPEQQRRLLEDRSLVASAVEETLRYDSPVQMMFRGAKEALEIGGAELRKGTILITLLGAANRDPAAFPDPDVYDVGRTGSAHIAFGHGIHFCLGAQLARLEARVVFEELFDLVPGLRIATPDDRLDYPAAGMLRSPKALVIQAL